MHRLPFRSLLVALLGLAAAAPAASASSVSVTVPAQEPNYWESVPFTIDGVADQDATVYFELQASEKDCGQPYPSVDTPRRPNSGVFHVGPGAFHQEGSFLAPEYNHPDPRMSPDLQLPGRFVICAIMRPGPPTHSIPAPPALAATHTEVKIGPDNCFDGAPKLTRRAVPGQVGTVEFSGVAPWQNTTVATMLPPNQLGPDVPIAGAFSLRTSVTPDDRKRLQRGMQVAWYSGSYVYKQRCVAPDGSTAPAPGDVLYDDDSPRGWISRDGELLDEMDAPPPPTFAGAVALGTIQTPPVSFPKPMGPGKFEREVRVVPAGSSRPALVASGKQNHLGLMEIKLTSNGGRILRALGKKVKRATLRMETTFKYDSGKTVSLPDRTMPIIRG